VTAPVAAIDCGTNSTRLLVVDGPGRTLDRQMRITRLGEGVDATGLLNSAAVARTVTVLEDYRRRMDELGVVRVRMAATSAARDAANADEFFSAAERAVGVRPELLSGEEEGRLSFTGATAHLPDWLARDEPLLVVDIGGGSTELVVGRPSDPCSTSEVSLDIGCVRASERFFRHDPPEQAELDAAGRAIRPLLQGARLRLPVVPSGGTLIGLAGTVSTLAGLQNGVTVYDRVRIHHTVLDRADVEQWLILLASEGSADRLGRSELMRGRQDVILGGTLILSATMATFDCGRCLVSEDDILDGLAASLEGPR
jgi:exopolyphosphatase/guanosine-5'-triphosphate,3'-diphosphate pyrophosphatase